MTNLAPIVVFVYSRPELTEQTLLSIAQNVEAKDSDLFVFSDGPKANASPETIARIDQVRAVVKAQKWCKNVTLFAAETNKGLANSVINGVTEIVNTYGKVIVVEDDVTVSPFFLQFMNDALNMYENDRRVSSIGSWNFFCPPSVSGDNFFLRHPDSIAWATFKRAWAVFNPDSFYLEKEIKNRKLARYVNLENTLNLMKMLGQQQKGKIDSWAVRWTASVVLEDMLTLYPQYPISRHEGYAEGTHFSGVETIYDRDLELAQKPITVKLLSVAESKAAVEAYIRFQRKNDNKWTRIWSAVKRLLQ